MLILINRGFGTKPMEYSICEIVTFTCDIFDFQGQLKFLVLWSALQLWKLILHGHLWYKCIKSVLIATNSFWSNNEDHNIHDIKRLLPSLSLAHAHFVNTSRCSWQKLPPKTNSSWPFLYSRKQHLWHFCTACDVFTNTML